MPQARTISLETVPPAEAFARWSDHRARFDTTGLWPVLVPAESVSRLLEGAVEQAPSVDDDLRKGTELDVHGFFQGRLAQMEEEMEEEDEEYAQDLDFEPSALTPYAKPPVEWQIAALTDLLGMKGSKAGIGLALVPCSAPWEVPAAVGYGGWNDCPYPAEHVAVLRDWHARHGAEPVVVGDDILELIVRPLADPQEARRVAVEQYAYCQDIVDQGTETVEALASSLLGASVWFFWWD